MNKSKKILFPCLLCDCALILVFVLCNIINIFAVSESDYVAEVGSAKYKNYDEAMTAFIPAMILLHLFYIDYFWIFQF